MKILRTSFFCIIILIIPLTAFGQTVEEVLAKAIEARGGEEALRTVNTLIISGKVHMPQMGIEMTFTRFNKRPNKMRIEVEYQGMKMIQATDGETCWTINPFTGSTEPEMMPDAQAAATLRDAEIEPGIIDMQAKGHSAELIGKETVDDKECYHIKFTHKDGHVAHYYIDTSTYLRYMTKSTVTTGTGGQVENTSKEFDYRKTGNFVVAYRVERKQGDQEMTMEVTEYKFDEPIEDSIFTMPGK